MGKIINDYSGYPNLNYLIINIKMKCMKIIISLIQY